MMMMSLQLAGDIILVFKISKYDLNYIVTQNTLKFCLCLHVPLWFSDLPTCVLNMCTCIVHVHVHVEWTEMLECMFLSIQHVMT